MHEDTRNIFDHLSLQNDSESEEKYILGLSEQFEGAQNAGSYHLALFAYHLLFICYFYQILHKLKIWMPEKYSVAMVSFDKERREKFRSALNPTDYVHNLNKESSFFEFLNVFCDCNEVVAHCKSLVKYRNGRLGHVNYLLVSEDAFDEQIDKYNAVVSEIHQLTYDELKKKFKEYLRDVDKTIAQTRDDLELNLVNPNKLSIKDLEVLILECTPKTNPKKRQVSKILQDDFNIAVN